MVPSFGARLRAEREQKQIALTAIADETKIKVSLLEGLEEDNLSFWPEGLFRRAYVRSYARAIGLEPEPIVREFLAIYPEPVEPDPAETMTPARSLLISPLATVSALLRRGSAKAPLAARGPVVPNQDGRHVVEPAEIVEPRPIVAPVEIDHAGLFEPADIVESINFPEVIEPVRVTARREPCVTALAELCTRLGRLRDRRGLFSLLTEATDIFDAVGLVVWSWDTASGTLRASFATGYSDVTVAQLPAVPADAANAVAAAFRSRETCTVNGGAGLTGAVTVPVLAPGGCAGVLAIELRDGCEQLESVRAFANILAAHLVGLVGSVGLAEAVA